MVKADSDPGGQSKGSAASTCGRQGTNFRHLEDTDMLQVKM